MKVVEMGVPCSPKPPVRTPWPCCFGLKGAPSSSLSSYFCFISLSTQRLITFSSRLKNMLCYRSRYVVQWALNKFVPEGMIFFKLIHVHAGIIGVPTPSLPPRYRDSVRTITPGLPLFLYNYSNHQLHGIFEAASFGGSNIDPTAWEDKKCPGESRFPAQVQVITRKVCDPLEEDSFRPILHHYDGPKFRLELSVSARQ